MTASLCVQTCSGAVAFCTHGFAGANGEFPQASEGSGRLRLHPPAAYFFFLRPR